MLLIIFLCLIAKLTSVCGDCDLGTAALNNFDWNKFSDPRPWYFLEHGTNDKKKLEDENKFDCPVHKFLSLDGNRILLSSEFYDITENQTHLYYGNAKNWNSTGYFELTHGLAMWSGQYRVIAIDYDRYFIMKACSFDSNEVTVYVAYRSSHPDEATKTDVLKDLKKNNINVQQLSKIKANHCQKA